MKNYTLSLCIVLLAGCGSDDQGTPAALDDIVGVWDQSESYGQTFDEWYFVIRENGELVDYDYQGDSVDMGENCYESETVQLTDEGKGNFIIDDGYDEYSVRITISGNSMIMKGSSDEGSFTSKIPRSSRLESSFTPLCSEFY